MMSKTHLAVGMATSMMLMQPKTKSEFVVSIIGGAVGGIMSDIDVKVDKRNQYAQKASMDAVYGQIIAAMLTIVMIVCDFIIKGGLCDTILSNPKLPLVGVVLFIVLVILGKLSKHREKTHSILFLILFTLVTGLINISLGISLFFGYASHLIVDLFNKSPIRLFYPLKKGICFKLCYADRLCNELLFTGSISLIILYLFI